MIRLLDLDGGSRLRDQLRTAGQRPSVALGDFSKLTPDEAELAAVTSEFGPICEAMYLMMSADGAVSSDERDVLRGALRNLSEDSVRGPHIEAMLDKAAQNAASEGRDARMNEVIAQLKDDPARSEVAFVLAAAIAFADNAIADEENDALNALAEGLGIDDARASELLDSVEADLTRR